MKLKQLNTPLRNMMLKSEQRLPCTLRRNLKLRPRLRLLSMLQRNMRLI